MNQFTYAKWWRSYLDKLWKSFWKLKFMKNQDLELHSPLPKSFKVCKERSKEKGKTEWRKQRTAAAVFLRTFGALPEVHFLHSIYHFKSQEVKNPMLQTVRDLELKWRSYSHCKQITPKCCEISLLLREFRSLFAQCCGFPSEVARRIPREGSLEPQGGSQLRSPVRIAWCCEVISQPSWVSAKSRRHHFHLRNGP